jgi:hypothetical protein
MSKNCRPATDGKSLNRSQNVLLQVKNIRELLYRWLRKIKQNNAEIGFYGIRIIRGLFNTKGLRLNCNFWEPLY